MKKSRKPDICPHGIDRNEKCEEFAFAGAISYCECCRQAFGHFGGFGTERCYSCRDEEFMKSIQPKIDRAKKYMRKNNIPSGSVNSQLIEDE